MGLCLIEDSNQQDLGLKEEDIADRCNDVRLYYLDITTMSPAQPWLVLMSYMSSSSRLDSALGQTEW